MEIAVANCKKVAGVSNDTSRKSGVETVNFFKIIFGAEALEVAIAVV